ncbi:hypothetical protein AAHB53_25110 [Niallia circulans]
MINQATAERSAILFIPKGKVFATYGEGKFYPYTSVVIKHYLG